MIFLEDYSVNAVLSLQLRTCMFVFILSYKLRIAFCIFKQYKLYLRKKTMGQGGWKIRDKEGIHFVTFLLSEQVSSFLQLFPGDVSTQDNESGRGTRRTMETH